MPLRCLQTLLITSDRVRFVKQGSVKMKDSEPAPPTKSGYEAAEGWKLVTNIVSTNDGTDYEFPKDQILWVQKSGKYVPLPDGENRQLGNMDPKKDYLVWYHHLWTTSEAAKRKASIGRAHKD